MKKRKRRKKNKKGFVQVSRSHIDFRRRSLRRYGLSGFAGDSGKRSGREDYRFCFRRKRMWLHRLSRRGRCTSPFWMWDRETAPIIQTKDGNMMIDAGNNSWGETVVAALDERGSKNWTI